MVKLHDKLYSGLLAPKQRLDLDFIPHMGIGNTKDPEECKKLVDEVNELNIHFPGEITTLDVLEYKNNQFKTLEQIDL